MSSLQSAKLWLIGHTDLARDALHIYVGLILLLGSAALFRWSLRSWKPWLVVFAATLLGEAWDMIDRIRMNVPQFAPGVWKDIWNTLFWPTALTLLARYTRVLKQ